MTRRFQPFTDEALERRVLLASFAGSPFATLNAGGTLSVVGTGNDDGVLIEQEGSNIVVRRNDNSVAMFPAADVKRAWINVFRGDDQVNNLLNLPTTIIGSSGNDTISSLDGDDYIQPGYGRNEMRVAMGHFTADYSDIAAATFNIFVRDTVGTFMTVTHNFGGFDRYDFIPNLGRGPSVHFIGTPGNDTITYDNENGGGAGVEATIFGGNGRDKMLVSSRAGGFDIPQTVADGGPGNDTIRFHGQDIFTTGINGGPGSDTLINIDSGGIAQMQIDGGSGHDFLAMFPANPNSVTEVHMPAGVEDLAFNPSPQTAITIFGNGLNNDIVAVGRHVTIHGQGGNDHLVAVVPPEGVFDSVSAFLNGGSGNDTFFGGNAEQPAPGGGRTVSSVRVPVVSNGQIVFRDDYLTVLGITSFQGGGGNDTVDYSGRRNSLSLSTDNVANDGTRGSTEADDIRADIETVLGGGGADLIIGGPFANRLVGNGGGDTLWGGDGPDTLDGGAGRDRMFGQGGADRLLARDGERDTLDGGNGRDTAEADSGVDLLNSVEVLA